MFRFSFQWFLAKSSRNIRIEHSFFFCTKIISRPSTLSYTKNIIENMTVRYIGSATNMPPLFSPQAQESQRCPHKPSDFLCSDFNAFLSLRHCGISSRHGSRTQGGRKVNEKKGTPSLCNQLTIRPHSKMQRWRTRPKAQSQQFCFQYLFVWRCCTVGIPHYYQNLVVRATWVHLN